ncbi:MAG: DNA polymerase III subunit gamma/tau, partial [Leptolyngbyaceae cyanobacterium bins.302]|nr:DNA polymerase III subunit gamma/tau [Leptolyngbyaceae cyanobacterium bins.302]
PQPPTAETPSEPDRAIPETSDLDKIWQDIIRVMTPYSSQVMVRQQCQLKSFDGQQAKIAVSTQQLLKMAQAKLPNIEAAFETVFSRKIHVVLEVSAISTPPTPETQAPDLPPTVPPPPSSPQNAPPNTPPQRASGSATPASPDRAKPSAKPGEADQSPPPPHDPVPTSKAWEMEDEVTRAAKNLAEFFAGKVVDLSDELEQSDTKSTEDEPPSPEEPLSTAATDPWNKDASIAPVDTEEDDEDLPF